MVKLGIVASTGGAFSGSTIRSSQFSDASRSWRSHQTVHTPPRGNSIPSLVTHRSANDEPFAPDAFVVTSGQFVPVLMPPSARWHTARLAMLRLHIVRFSGDSNEFKIWIVMFAASHIQSRFGWLQWCSRNCFPELLQSIAHFWHRSPLVIRRPLFVTI